jgi:hypothetical protein
MNLIDELQKLEQLHQNGSLTADEFTQAKTLILSSSTSSSSDFSAIKGFVEKESQLKRLDLEWETELQKFKTINMAMFQPLMLWSIVVGMVWGATAWFLISGSVEQEQIIGQPANFEPFKSLQNSFPIFSILVVIPVIWFFIRHSKQTNQNSTSYQVALKNHKIKRDQILRS